MNLVFFLAFLTSLLFGCTETEQGFRAGDAFSNKAFEHLLNKESIKYSEDELGYFIVDKEDAEKVEKLLVVANDMSLETSTFMIETQCVQHRFIESISDLEIVYTTDSSDDAKRYTFHSPDVDKFKLIERMSAATVACDKQEERR